MNSKLEVQTSFGSKDWARWWAAVGPRARAALMGGHWPRCAASSWRATGVSLVCTQSRTGRQASTVCYTLGSILAKEWRDIKWAQRGPTPFWCLCLECHAAVWGAEGRFPNRWSRPLAVPCPRLPVGELQFWRQGECRSSSLCCPWWRISSSHTWRCGSQVRVLQTACAGFFVLRSA